MLSDSSVIFLKRLLDTPGPSGFESAPARVWREEAAKFAKVQADVHGNSMATVNPDGRPIIMLAGHIDEIGVIIQHIDEDGYVHISGIGGWDPQVLVAQRIRFLGTHGDVIGVVGKKPIHLMKSEDRDKASKMTDLWVDIGAANRAEANEQLSVGDAGVIDSKSVLLPNNRIVSRSVDDRIGAFVVLEALRRYNEKPGKAKVVAAATTQEEIAWHGGGAGVSAPVWIAVGLLGAQDKLKGDAAEAVVKETAERRGIRSSASMRSEAGPCSCAARSSARWSFAPFVARPKISRFRTRWRRPDATPRLTRMRSTSRPRASRPHSFQCRIATCTRRTSS